MVKGKRKCPLCGVHYTGAHRFDHPELIRNEPGDPRDPTFRSYLIRSLIGYAIWILGLSVIIPVAIWLGGSVDGGRLDPHEYWTVVPMVLGLLWIFWIVWIVLNHRGGPEKRRALQHRNHVVDGDVICAACGSAQDRRCNYCSACGCKLLK